MSEQMAESPFMQNIPRHLEATFMKQKKQKKMFNLSKFVKRFFIFDLDEKRAILYFNSSTSTERPNDVIPLVSILAVRREEIETHQNRMGGQTSQERANRRTQSKSVQLAQGEKPTNGWIHVLEFETDKRVYRLFSDSYDVKEQWFYALNQIVLHKEFIDQHRKNSVTAGWRSESSKPANSQGSAINAAETAEALQPSLSSRTREQKLENEKLANETNLGLKRNQNWRKVLYQEHQNDQPDLEEESKSQGEDKSPQVIQSYRRLLKGLSASQEDIESSEYQDLTLANKKLQSETIIRQEDNKSQGSLEQNAERYAADTSPKNVAVQDIEPARGISKEPKPDESLAEVDIAKIRKVKSNTAQLKRERGRSRKGRNFISSKTSIQAITRPNLISQPSDILKATKQSKGSKLSIYPDQVNVSHESVTNTAKVVSEDELSMAAQSHNSKSLTKKRRKRKQNRVRTSSNEDGKPHTSNELNILIASDKDDSTGSGERKPQNSVTQIVDLLNRQQRRGQFQLQAQQLVSGAATTQIDQRKIESSSLAIKGQINKKKSDKYAVKRSSNFSAQPLKRKGKSNAEGKLQEIISDRGSDLSSSLGSINDGEQKLELEKEIGEVRQSTSMSGAILDKEMQTKLLKQQETEAQKRHQIYANMVKNQKQAEMKIALGSDTRNKSNIGFMETGQLQRGHSFLQANNEFSLGGSYSHLFSQQASNPSTAPEKNKSSQPIISYQATDRMRQATESVQELLKVQASMQAPDQSNASESEQLFYPDVVVKDVPSNECKTLQRHQAAMSSIAPQQAHESGEMSEIYSNKSLSEAIRERLSDNQFFSSTGLFGSTNQRVNEQTQQSTVEEKAGQMKLQTQFAQGVIASNTVGGQTSLASQSSFELQRGSIHETTSALKSSKTSTNARVIKIKRKSVAAGAMLPSNAQPQRIMRNSNSMASGKSSVEQLQGLFPGQPAFFDDQKAVASAQGNGAGDAGGPPNPSILTQAQISQQWQFKTQDKRRSAAKQRILLTQTDFDRGDLLSGEAMAAADPMSPKTQNNILSILKKQTASSDAKRKVELNLNAQRPSTGTFKRSQVKVIKTQKVRQERLNLLASRGQIDLQSDSRNKLAQTAADANLESLQVTLNSKQQLPIRRFGNQDVTVTLVDGAQDAERELSNERNFFSNMVEHPIATDFVKQDLSMVMMQQDNNSHQRKELRSKHARQPQKISSQVFEETEKSSQFLRIPTEESFQRVSFGSHNSATSKLSDWS